MLKLFYIQLSEKEWNLNLLLIRINEYDCITIKFLLQCNLQKKSLLRTQLFYHPWQNNLFLLAESITGCRIRMSERLWNGGLLLAAARLYKEAQWQIQSDQLHASSEKQTSITLGRLLRCSATCLWHFLGKKREKHWTTINTMKERRNTQPLVVRCKLVLVGDVQCGKTAMLQVLAKDCYPEVCAHVAHVSETNKMN